MHAVRASLTGRAQVCWVCDTHVCVRVGHMGWQDGLWCMGSHVLCAPYGSMSIGLDLAFAVLLHCLVATRWLWPTVWPGPERCMLDH